MEPINCPFCGGAAICDPVPAGKAGDYYKVFCRSVLTCGAAGSARPDPEDAIGMWNRRAGQHVVATEPPLFWRCFHCEYVARTREQAIEHFGLRMNERPASCLGNEKGAFLLPKQVFAASPSTTQQQEAGSGWRPIESAPKDGTWIAAIGHLSGGIPDTLQWKNAVWFSGYDNLKPEPTHWMPLPAAPSTPEKAEGGKEAPKRCGSYECCAAQKDGVLCADGECDRVSGVRPAGVALPDGGQSHGA